MTAHICRPWHAAVKGRACLLEEVHAVYLQLQILTNQTDHAACTIPLQVPLQALQMLQVHIWPEKTEFVTAKYAMCTVVSRHKSCIPQAFRATGLPSSSVLGKRSTSSREEWAIVSQSGSTSMRIVLELCRKRGEEETGRRGGGGAGVRQHGPGMLKGRAISTACVEATGIVSQLLIAPFSKCESCPC